MATELHCVCTYTSDRECSTHTSCTRTIVQVQYP